MRAAAFVSFFDGLADAFERLGQVERSERRQPFGECALIGIAVRRHGQPVAADGELVQMRSDLLSGVDAPLADGCWGRVAQIGASGAVSPAITSATGDDA